MAKCIAKRHSAMVRPSASFANARCDGKLQTTATYVGGQQLVNKVINFPDSEIKQTEAMCLVATVTEVAADDFWDLRFAEYRAEDEQLRHGNWKCWYSNGQLQAEGQFSVRPRIRHVHLVARPWPGSSQRRFCRRTTQRRCGPGGMPTAKRRPRDEYSHGRQVGVWRKWAEDGQACAASSNRRPPASLTAIQACQPISLRTTVGTRNYQVKNGRYPAVFYEVWASWVPCRDKKISVIILTL